LDSSESTYGKGDIEHQRSDSHSSFTRNQMDVHNVLIKKYVPVSAFVSIVRRTMRSNT